MIKKYLYPHHSFWLLMLLAVTLLGLGLVVSWRYVQYSLHLLWEMCQNSLQHLFGWHLLSWQWVIPLVILVIVVRGGWSMIRQIQATRQLSRFFYPLRQTPPVHLLPLLQSHGLSPQDIVFLDLTSVHAFCLGFWRPRIWLTAGLLELLSPDELVSVLAHEAHHCRQRDPLRLLISRALKAAFFFLPVVTDLAKTTELQQEIAADQSAILQLGNDLPLLCALQKLLRHGTPAKLATAAAYSPFNPTEARLRRLVYPSAALNNGRKQLANWLISAGIVLLLGSTVLFSPAQSSTLAQSTISQREVGACTIESGNDYTDTVTLLGYNL